jgi:hypothetical protein
VRSTRLLDGAFVDIVHWSAAEGAPFNEGLRRMTASEWGGQISDMAAAGIKTATIQALFINNMFVHRPIVYWGCLFVCLSTAATFGQPVIVHQQLLVVAQESCMLMIELISFCKVRINVETSLSTRVPNTRLIAP